MQRLLIVEDEPALRRALTINLKARHYEVEAVATGVGSAEGCRRRARPTWPSSTSAFRTWTGWR